MVGMFTLGTEAREVAAEDRELIQTIANQASLAMRLTRLADDARAAAAAKQEEREARLRAESVSRWRSRADRALERVATSPQVDTSLGTVLSEVVRQFGAVGGGVWRAEARGTATMIATVEDGEVRAVGAAEHPASRMGERPIPNAAIPRRGEICVDDEATIATRPDYAPFREYFARRGIRTVMSIPMFLGDTFRGALTLRFDHGRRLTPEEVELLHTFSNQAVLAMELTRLSYAARDAAVSEERNRLARDIHDTIAQGLAAIVRQLESVQTTPLPAAARRQIFLTAEIARENLVEARRSIRALRPASVDGRTFNAALQDLVQRAQRLSTVDIRFHLTGRQTQVPADIQNELLRIVNEALTNAITHANAGALAVDLSMESGSVCVVVRDDGAGFDPACIVDGVGLTSMRERAQRISAALTIASEPGVGTEIVVYWAADGLKADPR